MEYFIQCVFSYPKKKNLFMQVSSKLESFDVDELKLLIVILFDVELFFIFALVKGKAIMSSLVEK